MKYTLPLLVFATPAAAHHETLIMTALPYFVPWAMAASAVGVTLWRRWFGK